MTVKDVVRSFQQSVNLLIDEIYKEVEIHNSESEESKVYYARKVIKKWFNSYGIYK